jgi:hypothetical protein
MYANGFARSRRFAKDSVEVRRATYDAAAVRRVPSASKLCVLGEVASDADGRRAWLSATGSVQRLALIIVSVGWSCDRPRS